MSSVIVISDCCLTHLFGKLRNLAFNCFQVLDHILPSSLAGGLPPAFDFTILRARLVSPLEALRGKISLLFGRYIVVLVLGRVTIFDSIEFALAAAGFQLRDVDRGSRLTLRGLSDVVLLKRDAGVKITA